MAKKKKSQQQNGACDPETVERYREKFQKLDKTRKKGTAQAIARRRQDVWEMMCQGIPKTEIANILGVHRATIALDVKWWRTRVKRRVAKMKEDPQAANVELGLTITKLDTLTEAAFQEYSTAKTGSEKDKFLNTAGKLLSTKTRILQESGYLPKAGIEIKTKVEHQVSFADRFGKDSPLTELDDPTGRHKILEIAQGLISFAAQQAPIDVEGVARDVPPDEPPQDQAPDDDASPVPM